jgi:hypothetical protein
MVNCLGWLSRSLRFDCPRMNRSFVLTNTLSPRAKCGAIDGFEGACISSLCSCNTVRTRELISCDNLNRYAVSCETRIEGRMPNKGHVAPHEKSLNSPQKVFDQFRALE